MTDSQQLFFIEELLELLPSIHSNLIELSQKYSPILIAKLLERVTTLNKGANQVNLTEIQSLINRLEILINSWQETVSSNQKTELWQTYVQLQQSIALHLGQTPSGMAGILVKGESLVSRLQPQLITTSLALPQDILEQDLAQALDRLETTLDHPNSEQLAQEFHQQSEVLLGIGELLENLELIIITQSAIALYQTQPEAIKLITQRTLACWRTAQTQLCSQLEFDIEVVAESAERDKTDLSDNNEQLSSLAPASGQNLSTANFFLWLAGSNLFVISVDLVVEIVNHSSEQLTCFQEQTWFNWQVVDSGKSKARSQLIPYYRLSELIQYNYPLDKVKQNRAVSTTNQFARIAILRHHQQTIALATEVEQLIVIPELKIEPFDPILTVPNYVLGCTLLQDHRLVAVIDVITLLEQI